MEKKSEETMQVNGVTQVEQISFGTASLVRREPARPIPRSALPTLITGNNGHRNLQEASPWPQAGVTRRHQSP